MVRTYHWSTAGDIFEYDYDLTTTAVLLVSWRFSLLLPRRRAKTNRRLSTQPQLRHAIPRLDRGNLIINMYSPPQTPAPRGSTTISVTARTTLHIGRPTCAILQRPRLHPSPLPQILTTPRLHPACAAAARYLAIASSRARAVGAAPAAGSRAALLVDAASGTRKGEEIELRSGAQGARARERMESTDPRDCPPAMGGAGRIILTSGSANSPLPIDEAATDTAQAAQPSPDDAQSSSSPRAPPSLTAPAPAPASVFATDMRAIVCEQTQLLACVTGLMADIGRRVGTLEASTAVSSDSVTGDAHAREGGARARVGGTAAVIARLCEVLERTGTDMGGMPPGMDCGQRLRAGADDVFWWASGFAEGLGRRLRRN
ncbi:hypothetical protein C8R44DRAFT_893865 [Mycena epipterygia]|nr:hypothetical protein C8R44DRAFT_893865 [Mycena epipterygia]